jgi:hypothetical protein
MNSLGESVLGIRYLKRYTANSSIDTIFDDVDSSIMHVILGVRIEVDDGIYRPCSSIINSYE